MIFRITHKLAKKIKVVPDPALPPHKNPLLDWTANLFMVSRWQCIILTNSINLYSVVMPGRGIPNKDAFIKYAPKAMRIVMASEGLVSIFDKKISRGIDKISFCKTSDRSILGSMNDLVFHIKYGFLYRGLPLEQANQQINNMPMSMIGYKYPIKEFISLAKQAKS
jgi:hypothetical protein